MNLKAFPRIFCQTRVRSCEEIAEGVFELSLSRHLATPFAVPSSASSPDVQEEPPKKFISKIPAPSPGQFFMLRASSSNVLLGRPISVYHCDGASIRFLILKKGRGTEELCGLRKGDCVDVTGPSGTGFVLPDKIVPEDFKYPEEDEEAFNESKLEAVANASGLLASASAILKLLRFRDIHFLRVAIIGGGIGIAPVSFFASRFPEKCFDLFACFRSVPYGLEFASPRAENVFITTEDGSAGVKGILPDIFKPTDYDVVYACGPLPMLKYIKAACAGLPMIAFLSLEQRMACGAGACLGCSIPTVSGNKRCCVDGPVFNAEEVFL